jgi:GNAT superfamily N-acetyltransferase
MSASEHLSPVQFSHQPGTPREAGANYTDAVTANLDGRSVGRLHWSKGYQYPWDDINGQIQDVHVNPEHRRKGIATGMLKYARGIDPSVKHSHDLSEDGAEWSENTP